MHAWPKRSIYEASKRVREGRECTDVQKHEFLGPVGDPEGAAVGHPGAVLLHPKRNRYRVDANVVVLVEREGGEVMAMSDGLSSFIRLMITLGHSPFTSCHNVLYTQEVTLSNPKP